MADLLELKQEELERLVACIRDRVDQVGGRNMGKREGLNENLN